MRTRLFTTFSALLLLTFGALAQSSQSRFNIPFEFHVGAATLPPGLYLVSPQGVSNIMLIRSEDNRHNVMVSTGAVQKLKTPEHSSLIFNRYGEDYFLSEVWTTGYDQGRGLTQSALEREYARVASQVKAQQTAVARR